MTRNRSMPVILAVLAALAAGWMLGRANHDEGATRMTGTATPAERKLLYYRNPMGLPDTSPIPKKDPMGMDYIPVYAGEEGADDAGVVTVSPGRMQTLGVRTEAVRTMTLSSVVRTSGTVAIDETREHEVAPRFEGWVERLHADQTGMQVRAGQALVSVYSPQLSAARQEYRLADDAARRLAKVDPRSAASMERLRDAARTRLRNWEIGDGHLARSRDGAGSDRMILRSPANAVVIDKPIVQGARFQAGETILRLADLSTVWIVAKVPAMQAADVAVGHRARFETAASPGRSFIGDVAFVHPVIDGASRSVDVRVALPNPDGDLRPGLFGTVWLEQPSLQPVLSVPRSAVLEGGSSQTVLVQASPGRFEPREVSTGRRAGDRVEILQGVAEGEDVVVSANFLIDAESRLEAALQGLGAASGDTHAGHAMPAGDDPKARHPAPALAPHAEYPGPEEGAHEVHPSPPSPGVDGHPASVADPSRGH